MAHFKSGSNSRGNNQLMHGEGQSIISQVAGEQRIGNAVIQDKLETKDTPLSRMTNIKTTVIYYQQKITGRNDYVTNTGNLGSTDVNKNAFIKIKDFLIICQDALNVSIEKNEGNVSLMGDGTATILPKTIKPLINDYFIMNTLNKNNLYRIIDVTKTSIEQDSAYNITYQLVEENSIEELNKLEQNVVEKSRFIYAHVGTSFRTIFREEEYDALEKMEYMYQEMGRLYNDSFFNEEKNTYILTYNCTDIKDENGVSIEESRIKDQPWTVIDKKNIDPPKLNNSDVWYGSNMYDRMLVEFITRNSLFANIDRKIFRVTQLQTDLERWYNKTIFYAIEHQNRNKLQFRYTIPSPITRVTIASTLNLYGVVSIEPSMSHMDNCLELVPRKLFEYTLTNLPEDRSIKNISQNIYSSMVDLICETISLYINKREDALLERILLLGEHIDEFCQLSIKDQNSFYLFPMLSFVIRKTMDRLSDVNFGLSM